MELILSKEDKDEIITRIVAELKEALYDKFKTYSVNEVAEILKCHKNTVLNYIHNKILKAERKGKSFIITHENLNAFINK